MIRGIAKPYAARVKDGSNTITTAVSQKIFIQKVIAALVGIALDFTAPSLLSGISSNANCTTMTYSGTCHYDVIVYYMAHYLLVPWVIVVHVFFNTT